MTVFLSNCTKLKFDGFDPTTATVRWIIQNSSVEKDEPHAANALRAKCHWGLHIGMLKPTLSIRAFGDPLVRARKAGV